MSIAVLTQVYDEMRRLAIAGSMVAGGDFRLKKLIPTLEQLGTKAPVFAKVGEAAKAVVESTEQTSARALLELTTLVNAILYTQGETGIAGAIEPIETTDLGTPSTQASARVLKPLLEALTTTGSGRLEIIRDAFERGAFRDLRLVKPALAAIDDVYGELADLVADRILPLYGKAILPELRATFDMKGRAGHPRRLRLLHALNPEGTRALVKQSLEDGSKEVKVVAIECLGGAREDLSYLIEQASAKAQEVRQAAYRALAGIDDDTALATLQKAIDGKDLELAADSLRMSRNGRLLKYILDSAERESTVLRKATDKKDAGKSVGRTIALLNCLVGRDDPATEAFVLKIFGQRDALAKIKGDPWSGSDLRAAIVRIMECGSRALQITIANAHADLSPEELRASFQAARQVLPEAKVYDIFSHYVTARVDEKKKQRDPAWVKRAVVLDALGEQHYYYGSPVNRAATRLDPRWLDLAVETRNLPLIRQLIRPGHTAANAYLTQTFAATIKSAKHLHDCHEVVACMIFAHHPEATDAYVTALEKFGTKADYFGYWFGHLVVELPKSALPRLEALIPSLNDRVADNLLGYLQQLREKKD
jgi:hypothetical protein